VIGEHLRAALRSLLARPLLGAVMVLVLGTGAGILIVALAGLEAEARIAHQEYAGVYRVLLDRPPLVQKSDRPWLFEHISEVLLDGKEAETLRPLGDRLVLTYRGALPVAGERRPVRVTTRALFEVFGRRFVEGAVWPADDRSRSLVMTAPLARRLFGARAVGQIVDVDGEPFTVVGVVEDDEAQPYDLRFTTDGDQLFIPWDTGRELRVASDLALPGAGFVSVLAAGDVSRLKAAAHLIPCAEFWRKSRLQDPALFLTSVLSVVALFGCILNLARLFHAKFLAHAAPASIRRALGARRSQVLTMRLMEALLLAFPSSLVALALGWGGAQAVNLLLPLKPAAYRVDARILAAGVAATFAAALLAGVFPAYLASRVQPATQLRKV
jgi:putative ABC transport system permease protein